MKRTTKKKAPSRIKYEQSHPTISCRVPKELYDKLQDMKEREGKSFADVLKIGLGILKAKVQKEEEVEEKAYFEGFNSGYELAEQKLEVSYPCSVCGRPIVLSSEGEKQAASQYMQEHGWGHAECHEKRRRGYS